MPKRDSPPLACVTCGHVFGERDGFWYTVIDGKPGVWCLNRAARVDGEVGPRCQGPVPAARPANRSGTTTDCPHCDALLVWVGYEYSAGWQIVRSSDVESAD